MKIRRKLICEQRKLIASMERAIVNGVEVHAMYRGKPFNLSRISSWYMAPMYQIDHDFRVKRAWLMDEYSPALLRWALRFQ